ncbi:MAG: thioredoxin domain-containing protein [Acidobacteriota bacterium]
MNDFPITVTDKTFDSEVIESIRPVLVYFWAEWCEECRCMSQTVDAVANDKRASLQVARLNVDENPRMARRCLIRMVPTVILFMDGIERERIEGVTNRVHLTSTIDMHLSVKIDNEVSEIDSVN